MEDVPASSVRLMTAEGQTIKDKKELERYPRKKYQDNVMREKAVGTLREWESESHRQKNKGRWTPKLTMSVLMHSRASFTDGKALGVDDISSEKLTALLYGSVQKIKTACELYNGCNKENIETAAHEWSNDLGTFLSSMDVKQAFDNVTPVNLS